MILFAWLLSVVSVMQVNINLRVPENTPLLYGAGRKKSSGLLDGQLALNGGGKALVDSSLAMSLRKIPRSVSTRRSTLGSASSACLVRGGKLKA